MRSTFFRVILGLLYISGLVFVGYVITIAGEYYTLPLSERPRSPLHLHFKPGGLWGHGMGIIGSAMILLLFLYSARKREMFGLRWGKTSNWLNFHIFLGLMGPVLITLHTSFKFNGIVAISYYSMLAVMFSGIIGRYIYMQIPRDASGHTMSIQQLDKQDRMLTRMLREGYGLGDEVMRCIGQLSGAGLSVQRTGLAALLTLVVIDLMRPFHIHKLKRILRRTRQNIPVRTVRAIIEVAKQKSLLMRKRAFMDSMKAVFHYWHVIHKPFAWVMIVIMFIHIIVALLFGYRWLF